MLSGSEDVLKKEMFERHLKTGKLTDEDREFYEKTDWHPVNELPLKYEFIERLRETEKGRFIEVESLDNLFAD